MEVFYKTFLCFVIHDRRLYAAVRALDFDNDAVVTKLYEAIRAAA